MKRMNLNRKNSDIAREAAKDNFLYLRKQSGWALDNVNHSYRRISQYLGFVAQISVATIAFLGDKMIPIDCLDVILFVIVFVLLAGSVVIGIFEKISELELWKNNKTAFFANFSNWSKLYSISHKEDEKVLDQYRKTLKEDERIQEEMEKSSNSGLFWSQVWFTVSGFISAVVYAVGIIIKSN